MSKEMIFTCPYCGHRFDAMKIRKNDCPNCHEPVTVGDYYKKHGEPKYKGGAFRNFDL